MNEKELYDIIGVGIGPANLGLAALSADIDNLSTIFFDETPSFRWHPGMLIEGADLQVPFLADLVTLADPTNRFSFLNYIHKSGRMHQFFFFNRFDIPRKEYSSYAKWVSEQLDSCLFGRKVIDVINHQNNNIPHYEVIVEDRETKVETRYFSKNLVVGTGMKPLIPEKLSGFSVEDVMHTSQYAFQVKELEKADSILIVGSGQSAAEVFLEQLENQRGEGPLLYWYTRSSGFFQLEAGKLGQEIFSPDYIDYFHALPLNKRMEELPGLNQLRNGIEQTTLHKIYDLLYHRTVDGKEAGCVIQANTEIRSIYNDGEKYKVVCYQHQQEKEFDLQTEKIVLGTGYKPDIPDWYERLMEQAEREEGYLRIGREFDIQFADNRSNKIYSLTDLVHSHGAGATNLALAVHRNAAIINHVTGREIYEDRRETVFQQFSPRKKGGD
jgi:lysine N6-hydroxylase